MSNAGRGGRGIGGGRVSPQKEKKREYTPRLRQRALRTVGRHRRSRDSGGVRTNGQNEGGEERNAWTTRSSTGCASMLLRLFVLLSLRMHMLLESRFRLTYCSPPPFPTISHIYEPSSANGHRCCSLAMRSSTARTFSAICCIFSDRLLRTCII